MAVIKTFPGYCSCRLMIRFSYQASNDVLGAPISEKEIADSLDLDLASLQTEEDPITTSGFFQGDIMVASEDQLYQILEVRFSPFV